MCWMARQILGPAAEPLSLRSALRPQRLEAKGVERVLLTELLSAHDLSLALPGHQCARRRQKLETNGQRY